MLGATRREFCESRVGHATRRSVPLRGSGRFGQLSADLVAAAAQHGEHDVPYGMLVPRVERKKRDVVVDRQRPSNVFELMRENAVEDVDAYHEREADGLEVVDRGVAVVDAPGVHDDEGAEGTVGEVAPHEAETVLARCSEQVDLQVLVDRDTAEV